MSISNAWHVLSTAMRGLQNTQHAVSVINENIAGANDEYYTRRRPISDRYMDNLNPGVLRHRDLFIDAQYRVAQSGLGSAEVKYYWLSRVEDLLGDPVSGSFYSALNGYFEAWQDVESNPQDLVARMAVLNESRRLLNEAQRIYTEINNAMKAVGETLQAHMEEVNAILRQIQELNIEIAKAHRNQNPVPELEDRRDMLLDRLSTLTGAVAVKSPDNAVTVYVGSVAVLQGPTVLQMRLAVGENGPIPQWDGYPPNGPALDYAGGGAIAGLVQVRDQELARIRDEIVNFVQSFTARANAVHEAGYGLLDDVSRPLFVQVGTHPISWQVNPELTAEHLAVATTLDSKADNTNARAMLAIQDEGFISTSLYTGSPVSPRQFYRELVGYVGTITKMAHTNWEVSENHVAAATRVRQGIYGVSLDEEVAHLQLMQRAYQAIAQVIRAQDEMLDTLINRMR